ncbi:MAG: hypothetical protein P8P30_03920 [Rickettsiales bacterium]|nr:hypothetical protein [Rickettsiales bacterium]
MKVSILKAVLIIALVFAALVALQVMGGYHLSASKLWLKIVLGFFWSGALFTNAIWSPFNKAFKWWHIVYGLILAFSSVALYNSGGLSQLGMTLVCLIQVAVYSEFIFTTDSDEFFRRKVLPESADEDEELDLNSYKESDYQYQKPYRDEDLV